MDPIDAVETLSDSEIVDLTHTLEEGIPVWPTHPRFSHTLYESYELGDEACHYGLSMGEHTGTHIDAPLHFIPEGHAHYGVDEISLDRIVGRAAMIKVPDLDPGQELSPDRIYEWERDHDDLRPSDCVLFQFGWGERWDTGAPGRQFLEDWPGLSGETAALLADRDISLVGTDTLAIDATGSSGSPAHHELLSSQIYVVENLANLDRLPPFSTFLAFPLKIAGGSGSPVRAVAFVSPQSEE